MKEENFSLNDFYTSIEDNLAENFNNLIYVANEILERHMEDPRSEEYLCQLAQMSPLVFTKTSDVRLQEIDIKMSLFETLALSITMYENIKQISNQNEQDEQDIREMTERVENIVKQYDRFRFGPSAEDYSENEITK